jgi:hypothetical protein
MASSRTRKLYYPFNHYTYIRMAGRRSARVFLPLLVDEFRLVSWNSGTRPVESKGLARAANLALRGARYETSSYVRRARPGASARLPFAVPQEASQIGTSQQLDGAGVVLGVAPGVAPGVGLGWRLGDAAQHPWRRLGRLQPPPPSLLRRRAACAPPAPRRS